jgi:Mrr N-terminal domain
VRIFLSPKDNLHLPVLKVLNDVGGSLGSYDALEQVKSYYPQLTPDKLGSRLDSGEIRLNNRMRWSRFDLVLSGDVERGTGRTWPRRASLANLTRLASP